MNDGKQIESKKSKNTMPNLFSTIIISTVQLL